MAEQFTKKDLEVACDDLGMLPYFPSESRGAVMHLLAKMCPHKQALDWLVAECVNHVGKWPGPAELRGLLCTRYDAADGVDGYTSLPGYSAADMESRHIEKHEQLKAGGWEADRLKQLGLEPGKPLRQLAGGKRTA